MSAADNQCQPRLTATRQDDPTPQEFAAWADEAQACINSGEVFISDHRKANATVTALRSHATLKARVDQAERAVDVLESNARVQAKLLADTGRRTEELEAALRPFADIAQFVTETQRDTRPINFGMNQVLLQRLTIGHLRAARAAMEAKP